MAKVSILLPVYNAERYLRECIASVVKQRFTDFELLLGDDCSTDGTREIIQQFTDNRFRVFLRKTNSGLFPNLNALLKESRAPLVRILCQDDILEEACLEEEAPFFDTHPDIGMSFCKPIIIDAGGIEIRKAALGDVPEVMPPQMCMQHFFYHGCIPGNLSTVCVRRKCFDELGPFDTSYHVAADYQMWVRICAQKDLGVIHKHLVRLRSHSKQLSQASASRVQFIGEYGKIRSRILPLLPPRIRGYARLYAIMRLSVMEVHYSIGCLLEGRVKDFFAIVRIKGPGNFLVSMFFWIVTVNNLLYRPPGRFVSEGKYGWGP